MMQQPDIELLADVRVSLSAFLGHADASIREILAYRPGTVVPLHVAVDAPVPLLVNGIAIAQGEIVTLESGSLALEIVEVSLPSEFSVNGD